MLILLGYLVVLGTVFGGYMMTGGHLGALYQPAELIIIGGAGVGAFIVGNNGKSIKGTLKAIPLLFRRSKYTKSMYMDLLALLYRLMAKSRQQGMFSLERDIENPKATRFELRAPNPFTNTYLAASCLFLTALDGITYAITSGKAPADLLAELSKKPGEAADYLEAGRAYRCEDNVFEDFTQEERDAAFGKPPATVWENIKIMKANKDKVAVITAGDSLNQVIVDSFLDSIEYRWENELVDRIIPATEALVKSFKKLSSEDELDEERWESIAAKKYELIKDTKASKSIATKLKEALEAKDYDTASDLQIELSKKSEALEKEYAVYALNIVG